MTASAGTTGVTTCPPPMQLTGNSSVLHVHCNFPMPERRGDKQLLVKVMRMITEPK